MILFTLVESVSYIEAPCKSAINAVAGMPFKWSINPYRGCRHRCVYCFARQYQVWHELDAGLDFENKVFVKVNMPEVLRAELRRQSWRREVVVLGTATDCYQPVEGHYRITRRILEALRDQHNPVHLITKGTMVYRDLDVLAELACRAECVVLHSITTMDEDLWRRLEPGTPRPIKRLEVMRALVQAGVNAGVLMAPCLPGITTSPGALERVIEAAASYGARFVSHGVLRLAPGTREWFLGFLQREFPHLYQGYLDLYPAAHARGSCSRNIDARVNEAKRLCGLEAPRPAPAPNQLQPALFS